MIRRAPSTRSVRAPRGGRLRTCAARTDRRVPAVALAALAVLGGCDAIPLGDGPRKAVLRELDDAVIAPGYDEVAVRADALAAGARSRPALDDAGLEALRADWRALRVVWMRTQAHRIGPVRDDLFEGRIAQWPIDVDDIEALIAGDEPIDRAFVDGQGGNKKGMAAAEYLLFTAPAGGDVVAALAAPRRRAYLDAVLDALAAEAGGLAVAWRDDYGARFLAIGDDGAPFADIKEAVDAVVNASVFLAENVADGRLGKPLGATTGGDPLPALVESPWSDHGAADLLAAYDGLAQILDAPAAGAADPADPATGRLGALIAAQRPAVAARVRRELAAAAAAVAAMPHPLTAAVAARAPEVEAAWVAARALKTTYQTEVIAALGATLSLNDNDGD